MSRRRLSDEERTLWTGVTRSIMPLRPRRAEPAEPHEAPAPAVKAKPSPIQKPAPVFVPALPAPKPSQPPALAPLGRRLRKRVAKGAHAIDARFDLHGMTQAEAHDALGRFLQRAQANGASLVLVITGKGSPNGERGVLKRQVPMWLRLPDFRAMVVGFESAAIPHGGEGALYIRLRRTWSE
jgi:DNA-nicking Smr family endonuclease